MDFSNARPKTVEDWEKEERNKALVLRNFTTQDPDIMFAAMIDDYKQHSPTVADGKAGVKAFFKEHFELYPEAKANISHVAADGDYVWVHFHLVRYPGDRGVAIVDILLVKDGMIVEHWDVMQDVPETSLNNNTMF